MDHCVKQRLLQLSVIDASGCRLWTGCIDRGGYGRITIGGRKGSVLHAHRVSYEVFVTKIPDGAHVLHKCDVRRCINPEHLFIGSNADNVADREQKGRGRVPMILRGEENPVSLLSKADVIEIRRRVESGEYQAKIAADFGVSKSLISMIHTRKRWAHI